MPAGLTGRNYGKLLDTAEQMNLTGYLDAEDLKRQRTARARFKVEVRNFVYALFREGPDHGPLAVSVTADLQRIAATGAHSEAAIADTRAALLAEIDKRSRNSPAMRFFIRWVLPALGLAAAAAFGYFKLRLLG